MAQKNGRVRKTKLEVTLVSPKQLPVVPPKIGRILWVILALSMGTVFGWLTHWEIFEYDVFWLIRAGEEIVRTHSVQHTDTWSFTILGEPWYHFQWLTSVVMYFYYKWAGSYESLTWLRSGLVCLWMATLMLLTRFATPPTLLGLLVALIVAPWIYLISWIRLQMRPDLFAVVTYPCLLLIFMSPFSRRVQKILGLGSLLIWSNFHAGTVPIGIFLYGSWLVFGSDETFTTNLKRNGIWILTAISTWFLTPQWFHILEVLQANFQSTKNPDLQPFRWNLLLYSEGGWTYSLWLIYSLFGFISYPWTSKTHPIPLYRHRIFVALVTMALTLLTFERIRAIHYQAIFLLPVVAYGLFSLLRFLWLEAAQKAITAAIALATLVFFWGVAIPNQKSAISPTLGAQISKSWIPVDAVEFLKKIKPQKNLLNHFNFGGYIIGVLPEYPTAIDGRELIFLSFERDLDDAKLSPQRYATLLEKYSVQAIMDTAPPTQPLTLKSFDRLKAFYPESQWALVYVDHLAMIYLRRIPAHEEAIRVHEGSGGLLGTITGKNKINGPAGRNISPAEQFAIDQVLLDIRRRQDGERRVPKNQSK